MSFSSPREETSTSRHVTWSLTGTQVKLATGNYFSLHIHNIFICVNLIQHPQLLLGSKLQPMVYHIYVFCPGMAHRVLTQVDGTLNIVKHYIYFLFQPQLLKKSLHQQHFLPYFNNSYMQLLLQIEPHIFETSTAITQLLLQKERHSLMWNFYHQDNLP